MTRQRCQPTRAALENFETYEVPLISAPQCRALLAHLPIASGHRLLDVACGTGIVAREAAYMVGTKGTITGLDLNEEMLHVARRHAPTRSAQLEWRHGDAQHLPFPDNHFDIVVCQQGLQYFEEKLSALSEMRRVLEPGGWVGLCVWRGIEESPLHHAAAKAFARHVDKQAAALLHTPFSFDDADALNSLMSSAGFAGIEIWAAIETILIPEPETAVPALLASSPAAPMFAGLNGKTRTAIIAEVLAALEPYRTGDAVAVPQGAYIALAQKPHDL